MADSAVEPVHLRRAIADARDIASVRAALRAISVPALSATEAVNLRLTCFGIAHRMASSEPDASAELLTDELLPACLSRDVEQGASVAHDRYRDLLAKWLAGYAEPLHSRLRMEVLARCVRELGGRDARPACWLIAAIGYRSPVVTTILDTLSRSNDQESADVAFATRIALGTPVDERPTLVRELNRRVKDRLNHSLLFALHALADPKSVRILSGRLRDGEVVPADWSLAERCVRAMTRIADRNIHFVELQDQVWKRISELYEQYPEAMGAAVYLGGDVAPRVDSARVIPDFFRWFAGVTGSNAARKRDLILTRVADCYRPRQLTGWHKVVRGGVAPVLRVDAVTDTAAPGRYVTETMRRKQAAWEAAVCLGIGEMFDWVEPAVASETSPYASQQVLDLIACFRMREIPDVVARLIEEPYDEGRSDGDGARGFVARAAATRLARSTPTSRSLAALLTSGLRVRGGILLETVNAAGDVAVELLRSGNPWVLAHLVAQSHQKAKELRVIALAALRAAASAGLVGGRYADEFLLAAKDPKLDEHARATALESVGYLPAKEISARARKALEWFAAGDGEVGDRALEALERTGALSRRPRLLAQRLGLVRRGATWDADGGLSPWSAYLVSLLHERDPASFEPAMISVIRLSGDDALALAQRALVRTRRISRRLLDALVERVGASQDAYRANTTLFGLLAEIGPRQLTEEPWERRWADWMPDSRAALADALGTVGSSSKADIGRASATLILLSGDSMYGVRRTAYRALARLAPKLLAKTCAEWAASESVDDRRRAAEAIGWIRRTLKSLASDKVVTKLAADPELAVRAASERGITEARHRNWAAGYLRKVIAASERGNRAILKAFPFGEALGAIADDDVLRILESKAAQPSVPAHGRRWLERISKAVEASWLKATRDWPEPWLPCSGMIEDLTAKIDTSKGAVDVRCVLWKRSRTKPNAMSSWGGSFEGDLEAPVHPGVLKIRGRAAAQIVVTQSSSDGSVLFVGSGPYPERR